MGDERRPDDRWILVVFSLDDENMISDGYQEDLPSESACRARVRVMHQEGVFCDVTDEHERENLRLIERRGTPRDATDPPPFNPSFEWIPPHAIVKVYWFQTWDHETA